MKNSPKTLRDVARSIADASDAIEEIERSVAVWREAIP